MPDPAGVDERGRGPAAQPAVEAYWGNVNPISLQSCFDEGKRRAETLFFDYHRQHGIATRVARIFNTYGPRMHPQDGRVISNFTPAGAARRGHHDLRRRHWRARSATSI